MSAIRPYTACLVQCDSLERAQELLRRAPEGTRLAVLPELPAARPVRLPEPGLSNLARQVGLYVAAAVWEDDPEWPGITFQTGVLLSPGGEIVLKRRKLQGCGQAASPLDFYSRYKDSLFPVAETDIGKIGLLMNQEILYLENARCLAFAGAEVICHLTAEAWDDSTDILAEVKSAASGVNNAYLLSADTARAGRSIVTDWMGRTVAASTGPGEGVVSALLEVERVRFERSKSFMVAGVNSGMWAREYHNHPGLPLDSGARNDEERRAVYARAIQEQIDSGVLKDSALRFEE